MFLDALATLMILFFWSRGLCLVRAFDYADLASVMYAAITVPPIAFFIWRIWA